MAHIDGMLSQCNSYQFRNKARIKDEVARLSSELQTLTPDVSQLVHNDGRTETLLRLKGTIPMYHRGNRYNIPVHIWISSAYPNAAPAVFVTPTKDMSIKQGHRAVDRQGRVFLPYLSSWRNTSNLEELCGYLSSTFGEEPPCYANPGANRGNQNGYANNGYNNNRQGNNGYGNQNGFGNNNGYGNNANGNGANGNNNGNQMPMTPGSAAAARKEKLAAKVTEKLRAALTRFNETTSKEIDSLMANEQKLSQGAQAIEQGFQSLQEEKNYTEGVISALDTETARLEGWLEANEGKEVNADAIVEPADPLSKQLLDTVATDNAVSDTLYVLDKALQNDRIDLRTFLKQVRKLARKQFLARALAIKINKTINGR